MAVICALMIALCAAAGPFVSNILFRREFRVHEDGGIVLISGASSGIGKHAAMSLAKNERFVVFAGVRNEKDAENTRGMNIPNLYPILLDVTDASSIERARTRVEAESKERGIPLVGLVNNAGVGKELPLEVQPLKNIRQVYEVNVFGVVALTKAFVPLLRQSEGRIVNVGSVAGRVTAPMKGTYASSKHALEALNDAFRMELGHWGISVSIVQPAYVKTRIAEKQTGKNAQFKRLPPKQRDLYAHIFDAFETRRLRAEARADLPDVTTAAITHAIKSKYPRTRYPVANVHGIPANVFLSVLPFLPDRLLDRIKGA
eukprot:g1085.t1